MSLNPFVTKTSLNSYVAKKSGPFFNPCVADVPILFLLKTQENLSFSGVFRKHKIGALARNGLIKFCNTSKNLMKASS